MGAQHCLIDSFGGGALEPVSVMIATSQGSGIAAARGVVFAIIFGFSSWGMILGLAWIALT